MAHSTPALSELDRDWLDALGTFARVLAQRDGVTNAQRDIRALYANWTLSLTQPLGMTHRLVFTVEDRLCINLPRFGELPKIERVEILLYAAVGVWYEEHMGGQVFDYHPRESFQNLCFRAGCWHTNTTDIRERWRLIDWQTPAEQLPISRWETRPKCKVCQSPVATDAGAWRSIHERNALPDASRTRLGPNDAPESYDPRVHEECLRYAHRVLMPQLVAAREAAVRVANREGERI